MKACRYDCAIFLYNQAINLDKFNYEYYHDRVETLLSVCLHFNRKRKTSERPYLELAIFDAQRSLDLSPNVEVPWLTMIRASMELDNLEDAQRYLDMASRVVSENNTFVSSLLDDYQRQLHAIRRNTPLNIQVLLNCDAHMKDDYFFAYSTGMHNHGSPELIAVDLEMNKVRGLNNSIFWTCRQALAGSIRLNFGDIYKLPGHRSIIPIPMSIMDDPEATRQGILPLMGAVPLESKIVVLIIHDYFREDAVEGRRDINNAPTEPLTEEQAKRYLQAMVDNAHQVESLYSRGIKLVAEA